MYVSREPCLLVCHGLGSCVGLFLYDRTLKTGAGAHIQLPFNNNPDVATDGRHADFAFAFMLRQMKKLGSLDGHISAKMTGGAHINRMDTTAIGARNLQKIRELLRDHKIYLSRSETGGHAYRRASFNTVTGQLAISQQHVELII